MNPFTFLFFAGGTAVAAAVITGLAVLVLIGFVISWIAPSSIRAESRKNACSAVVVPVVWVLAIMFLTMQGSVFQSVLGRGVVPSDSTGVTEQALVVIPDSDRYIATEGKKMFAAIDEDGDTTLLEVDSVQYADIDQPTLRADATCEEWVAPLQSRESGYLCETTYTAILPR